MFLSQFVYFASSYGYYEMLCLKRNDNRKKTYKKIENKIRKYTYIIYDLRDGGKKNKHCSVGMEHSAIIFSVQRLVFKYYFIYTYKSYTQKNLSLNNH